MSGDVKWHRVIDPLSPLYGCDVRLTHGRLHFDRREKGQLSFATIDAMRRVDIFVGDRPFQLVAPAGETLGLMIDVSHLEPSPLQDDIVELSTDLPYGEFLEEVEDGPRGDDGAKLTCVAFESLYQVALVHGNTVVSRTLTNENDDIVRIREAFSRGDHVDDLRYMIERAV